jgi:hypothetical protein
MLILLAEALFGVDPLEKSSGNNMASVSAQPLLIWEDSESVAQSHV